MKSVDTFEFVRQVKMAPKGRVILHHKDRVLLMDVRENGGDINVYEVEGLKDLDNLVYAVFIAHLKEILQIPAIKQNVTLFEAP